MDRTVFVTCPHCEAFLEVNPANGKVVRSFPAGHQQDENKDRLSAALDKMKSDASTREDRFEQKKKEAEGRKDKLSELFDQEKKRAREEGVTGPEIRPIDLD